MKISKFLRNSSRKILVLSLAVLMVVTSVITASASTAVTNQTVYSPLDLFDGSTLMYTTSVTQPQLKDGAYDTSVWKFCSLDSEGNVAELLDKTDYVKPTMAAKLDTYYKFSKIGVSSYYKFYNTTNKYDKNTLEYTQRHIEFLATIEGMALGFAAPVEGTYEIAAPLLADADKNVKYSVIKVTAEGKRFVLQAEKTYAAGDENFCCIMAKLSVGDTVYLIATADADAVINVGIPEARLITSDTYTYLFTDYLEDATISGRTYPSGTAVTPASTADTRGAWDFGYFKYGAEFTDRITTLTLTDFALPAVGEQLDTALLSLMTDYELFEDGKYYNASDVNAEAITTATSGPGVMYNDGGTIYTGFHSYTEATDAGVAYGHYFKFTAPVAGEAALSFGENGISLGNQAYIVVALNGVVTTMSYKTADTQNGFTFADIKQGDEITVMLMSGRYNTLTSAASRLTFTAPFVTIANTIGYSAVSFDADGGHSEAVSNDFTVNGTVVTVPTATKSGCRFNGWNVGGELLAANEQFTVSTDVEFTADYDYYGDLNGDKLIDDADQALMRKYILGTAEIDADRIDLAKLNSGDEIDICDMVILSKTVAGY